MNLGCQNGCLPEVSAMAGIHDGVSSGQTSHDPFSGELLLFKAIRISGPTALLLTLLIMSPVMVVFGQGKMDSLIVIGKPEDADASTLYRIQGRILNAQNNSPVTGASIFFNGIGKGTTTDEKGEFKMPLKKGRYRVAVRHIGMASLLCTLEVYGAGIIELRMVEKSSTLDEVIIMAESEDRNIKDPLSGVNVLTIQEIKKISPFLGEVDIIKSLQLLPGISTVGEGASGFHVRGGRTDQNLILLDGIQLFNTSHLLGFFSTFNPDATNSFSLYKGNVPAQYGGRSSSVLDVKVKNGNFEKYKISAGAGLISSRLMVEGPIIKNKTSFLVASRFSYSDWLLQKVKNADVRSSSASFYDITANVAHRFNEKNQLTLTMFQSHDYFRYSKQFGYEYTSSLAGFNWNNIINAKWSTLMSASYGDYRSAYFDPQGADSKTVSNGIGYYHLQENIFFIPNEKHSFTFGLEHTRYSGKPESSKPYSPDPFFQNESVPKDTGREYALFINDEVVASSKFSFSAGLRFTYYQNIGEDDVFIYPAGIIKTSTDIIDTLHFSAHDPIATYKGIEPRLSLKISVSAQSSVKISYNRMRQNIHQISNAASPTPVDIWQVSNYYIQPQVADNYSIGYFRNFKQNTFETYFEAYFKSSKSIIEYKNFAELLLNKTLETELVAGEGKSYGAELFLKKNIGEWNGWIAYTYSRSFVKVATTQEQEGINQDEWFPSNYDKPHNLTVVANRKLQKSGSFGFTFTYSTGRPVSAVTASYQSGPAVVPLFSKRNEYRIPDYMRIDCSLTIGNIFPKIDDSLTLAIYNFLGRKNAYSVYYQRKDNIPLPQSYRLSMLGTAFPSATYTVTF
jgi:hypothetical protein